MFADVSRLDRDALLTSNHQFFIRTAFPPQLLGASRLLEVTGLVARPQTFTLDGLEALSIPAGTHLIECSGNTDAAGFGLMSAARWEGVPITSLLDRVEPLPSARRVLIVGEDDQTTPSRTSVAGASWIFAREDLDKAKAFLALRMNGEALPRDHGSPLRLVVPGWYGCACIKWVNRIELVADESEATSQMREYAARTHQTGQPPLARDYVPAVIDTAAMPVRIEQWVRNDRLAYRVVGIVWGGSRPSNALMIRFKHTEGWVPVDDCPVPASSTTWSVWWHWWTPGMPGRYEIVLKIADPSIRTRRLDLFFYVRTIQISEV
jgi:DMSO/TMAO reductase YedYZ molybdopterin-dependent catalytic subunit